MKVARDASGRRKMWKHPSLSEAYFLTDVDEKRKYVTYQYNWGGLLGPSSQTFTFDEIKIFLEPKGKK